MTPALPPLSVEEHEFLTTRDCDYTALTEPGWYFVTMAAAESYYVLLWARRRDGLPVACSNDHALRMSAATLAAMAKTRDELVTLARAATKAKSPEELQRAISDLGDWLEDYDATRGTQ